MGHLRENGDDGTAGGSDDRSPEGAARRRRIPAGNRLRSLRDRVERGIRRGSRRADAGFREADMPPEDPTWNTSRATDKHPPGFGPEDLRPGGRRRGRHAARSPHPFVEILPALIIVVAIVLDQATPTSITASPLFAAAPLVAAPFFSLARTLVVGIVSVAAILGLHFYNDTAGGIETITESLTVFTVSILALAINGVVRRSGERLASARVIAEAAQRAVLPTPAARIGGLHIAARYEAAEEGAFIGGDLFAVQDTAYGVRLVVGDVRGKGMGAVETVAVVIGAFREAAEQESSLEGSRSGWSGRWRAKAPGAAGSICSRASPPPYWRRSRTSRAWCGWSTADTRSRWCSPPTGP